MAAASDGATPASSPLVDAQTKLVFARYGHYLDPKDEPEVRRLLAGLEKQSAALAAHATTNADEPAPSFVVKRGP